MAWYRTGTISLTNGSTTVTGSSTAWIANAAVGEALYAPDGKLYEIASVASNTSLTLATPYLGTTASGQTYVIVPSQSYIRDLAAQAATLVNNYSTIYNTVGQGKFAEGTVSAPSITFATDTDTGFYHSAANEVTFVANGQAIFKYNTSGLSLTSGSLSLAGSNTLGDSDSGDTQTLNGATVINANSSSAGLRITQTGGGNALLVEDSANPDSTPFVVDASGKVLISNKTPISALSGRVSQLQYNSVEAISPATILASFYSGTNYGSEIQFIASKSGIAGMFGGAVANGQGLGSLQFYGDDGAAGIPAAQIYAAVDGTPGTNDMPGRLVFSTTADGASSPTERMRIDSKGQVSIGGFGIGGGRVLAVQKAITGDSISVGIQQTGIVQSDVTQARSFRSVLGTAAASFTLTTYDHYYAESATLGAGSAITNQYGFRAESSLTGATNNYGFYSNIASGTGRYNFYAAGSASNYFAGQTQIGSAGTLNTSSGVSSALQSTSTSDGTINLYLQRAGASTNSTQLAFTKTRGASAGDYSVAIQSGDGLGFIPFEGSDGVSALRRAAAISVIAEGLFSATSAPAYMAFSTTASGSVSPTERMRIDSAGRVGIGLSPSSNSATFQVGGVNTTGTYAEGIMYIGSFGAGVNTRADSFFSYPSVNNSSGATPTLNHFYATQGTFTTAVTNQYGFNVSSALTGATNNYGFYSNIASGTGRYNFYAAGSADNYFSGNVLIGTTSNSGNRKLLVSGIAAVSTAADDAALLLFPNNTDNRIYSRNSSSLTGAVPLTFYVGNTESMRIDANSNVIQSAPTTAPTLSTNGTMVFNLTSNTNLRVSVRGSDGVTRTANITLA